jgi:hypothetical protein
MVFLFLFLYFCSNQGYCFFGLTPRAAVVTYCTVGHQWNSGVSAKATLYTEDLTLAGLKVA